MDIKGLGWPTSDGDRRVWDWWEMGFFDERERERDYTFWFFRFLVFIFLFF